MQAEVKSVMESIVDDVTSIRKPEVRIIKNGHLKVNIYNSLFEVYYLTKFQYNNYKNENNLYLI